MIELIFKKDKQNKTYKFDNETTAKTIKKLMEAKGWKFIRAQKILNF